MQDVPISRGKLVVLIGIVCVCASKLEVYETPAERPVERYRIGPMMAILRRPGVDIN